MIIYGYFNKFKKVLKIFESSFLRCTAGCSMRKIPADLEYSSNSLLKNRRKWGFLVSDARVPPLERLKGGVPEIGGQEGIVLGPGGSHAQPRKIIYVSLTGSNLIQYNKKTVHRKWLAKRGTYNLCMGTVEAQS